MPLGIGNKGKNGGNQPKFEPTEVEREFLAPFLEDIMVPFYNFCRFLHRIPKLLRPGEAKCRL